ncbi:MAG: IS1595 family transposase [Patescibacteria group bacterium]
MKQRFTIADFNKQYPSDEACLDEVFQNRYGALKSCPGCGVVDTKFFKLKGRKAYSCMHCGHQLHPLAGTIFHKSATPLKNWFYAIYLFSTSKNGVSAKELERQLGCTYKTAWRIAKQVRLLMEQNADKLDGIVEADETFIGGRIKGQANKWTNKTAVIGATERKGKAKAWVAEANVTNATPFIKASVSDDAELHTDESAIYRRTTVSRKIIKHVEKEYVRGNIHTNSIEGFWSQLKRSINGTYHAVSPKYLQTYVDEFVFRYNLRNVLVYPVLIERAAKRV